MLIAAGALVFFAAPAMAGMPLPLPADVTETLRLADSQQMRLQAISFFVVVLLTLPFVVRWLWNCVAGDFPRMPRINYGKSFLLVMAWGLLSLVVLTMIAATREMMTPGVWQKQGLLYKLPPSLAPAAAEPQPTEEHKP